MKSTIGAYTRHKGIYSGEIFKAIIEMNLRYYTSATEFMVVWVNGVWMSYDEARKYLPTLPKITYKD